MFLPSAAYRVAKGVGRWRVGGDVPFLAERCVASFGDLTYDSGEIMEGVPTGGAA